MREKVKVRADVKGQHPLPPYAPLFSSLCLPCLTPHPYQVRTGKLDLHLMQNFIQKNPLLLESHPHLQHITCVSSQRDTGERLRF